MTRCVFCKEEFPDGLGRCPNCGAEMADGGGVDPALEGELLDLIDRGDKIAAIHRYREATGAGLAAAKAAVEAIVDGRLSRGLEPVEPVHRAAAADPPLDPAFETELLDLLTSGKKIDAVKHYRGRTGTSLKESKDAVERLAARHGIAATGSGCFGAMLLVAGAATAAGWLFAAG